MFVFGVCAVFFPLSLGCSGGDLHIYWAFVGLSLTDAALFSEGPAWTSQQLAGGSDAHRQHCTDLGKQRVVRTLHAELVRPQGFVR